MTVNICVPVICFTDSNIEQLTSKILMVTLTGVSPGTKTFILNNAIDKEKILFRFLVNDQLSIISCANLHRH